MFKIHELREIIRMLDQSSIEELKLDHEGSRLILRKHAKGGQVYTTIAAPQPAPIQQVVPEHRTVEAEVKQEVVEASQPVANKAEKVEDTNLHQIKSPMVGTFYQAPSPDAEPYVKIGDVINETSIVCIVEAMKLFNEIEAEVKGEIVEILVENGQLVEYGQPLFLVKQK